MGSLRKPANMKTSLVILTCFLAFALGQKQNYKVCSLRCEEPIMEAVDSCYYQGDGNLRYTYYCVLRSINVFCRTNRLCGVLENSFNHIEQLLYKWIMGHVPTQCLDIKRG